jgi:hypothetical protein
MTARGGSSGPPRWVLWLGIGVGLWYVALLSMGLGAATIIMAAIGLLTIGGCIYRLWKRGSERK